MEFTFATEAVGTLDTPLIAVPTYSDEGDRGAAFGLADEASGGLLSRLADEEGFKPESGKSLLVHTPDGPARRWLLVGMGEAEDVTVKDLRGVAAAAVQQANQRKLPGAAVLLEGQSDLPGAARFCVEGASLGGYRYDVWRTKDVEPTTCETFTLALGAGADGSGLAEVLARASAASGGVALARDLVNGPPVEVTPTYLAAVAADLAKDCGLELKVFGQAELEAAGMNLLLAVAVGSEQEPKLIHLTYRPAGATQETPAIALVGKGVTFDAGGYNLKPTGAIEDMKIDMAGAAAVLGAMKAVAACGSSYVVHGIVPAVENLISGRAYKDGDVFRSLEGKTVEILNTDAEGRLILADALTYASRLQGVERIVDLATLTGACVVALGPHSAGLWSSDDAFRDRIAAAAEAAGEDVWAMPLDRKLKSMLKSDVADLKNVGQRWGGAITAALFLSEFVGETTWAHLDIAGPASAEKPDAHIIKGGTGFGVLTLLELVRGEV